MTLKRKVSEDTTIQKQYVSVPSVTPEVKAEEGRFAKELEACNEELIAEASAWLQGEISGLGSRPSAGSTDYDAWMRKYDVILDLFTMLHSIAEFRFGTKPCEVMGCGSNDADALGEKPISEKTDILPLFIRGFTRRESDGRLTRIPIRAIAAGGQHNLALSNGGKVYSWGNSDDGTLGRSFTGLGSRTPHPVTGFKNIITGEIEDSTITQVAAGDSHSLFLSMSGAVYQCGTYRDGEGGNFRIVNSDMESPIGSNITPVHISKMPRRAIMIFARANFSAAILDDYTLVTWGFGSNGELGRSANMQPDRNDKTYDLTPNFYHREVTVTDPKTGIATPSRELIPHLVTEHFLTPKPVLWQDEPKCKRMVLSVSLGLGHMLVVAWDADRGQPRVYGCGVNKCGQLGLGMKGDAWIHKLTLIQALRGKGITQVACGNEFSLACSNDGRRLFSFGRGDNGPLGHGYLEKSEEDICTPKPIPFPEPVIIQTIGAGDTHSLAITNKRVLYTWGFNIYSQTGFPNKTKDKKVKECVKRPQRLDLLPYCNKDQPTAQCDALGVSGGGQHSLFLVKRSRPSKL